MKTTKSKRPTQADVARLAGVSQAMVSYILNDNAAIAVPDETRQRIIKAIAKLGYVPDRAAQSLRTRKTYTIACIIPDITNPFYPAFERGLQDVAERHGYDLITYNSDGLADKELKCLHSAQRSRVEGIVGVFFHLTAAQLRPLLDRGVSIVRLESRKPGKGPTALDNLFVDNCAAARAAVCYLIEKGHTRIGMLAGQLGPRAARVQGYQQALESGRIPLDPSLVREGPFAEEGGYQGMCDLLARSPRPTAVFAANDLIAMGALVALREAGLQVPRDVAVVGFDDIPFAKLVSPPLTTVAQFQHRLGQRAAEMVFERLGGHAPPAGRSEEMPYQLIVRESA